MSGFYTVLCSQENPDVTVALPGWQSRHTAHTPGRPAGDGVDPGPGQQGQLGHHVLKQGSSRGHHKARQWAGLTSRAGRCEKSEGRCCERERAASAKGRTVDKTEAPLGAGINGHTEKTNALKPANNREPLQGSPQLFPFHTVCLDYKSNVSSCWKCAKHSKSIKKIIHPRNSTC